MKYKWELDENTVVEFNLGIFSKKQILVNGNVIGKMDYGQNEMNFILPDARPARITFLPRFGGQPVLELSVNDQLMVETGKEPIKCPSCSAVAKSYDKFCGNCGQSMPDAKYYQHGKYIKEATLAMKWMSVLYIIFGFISYFTLKSQANAALLKLEGLSPESIFPQPINGVSYSVAALKSQLLWEPWGALIVNAILAVVMGGLSIWGKRSPLAAVLIATATFLVVNAANGIADPKTLAQGIYVKILIIVFLVRGIKSALAIRTANV
ncbi:MAG: zinc ribbon domain-containing protein [Methylomonas sp.]|jgi:hypothetical protein